MQAKAHAQRHARWGPYPGRLHKPLPIHQQDLLAGVKHTRHRILRQTFGGKLLYIDVNSTLTLQSINIRLGIRTDCCRADDVTFAEVGRRMGLKDHPWLRKALEVG